MLHTYVDFAVATLTNTSYETSYGQFLLAYVLTPILVGRDKFEPPLKDCLNNNARRETVAIKDLDLLLKPIVQLLMKFH